MDAPTVSGSPAARLQRQRLLDGPILATLLAHAWPTMVQMLVYSAVLLLETWFIGKLGVIELAGASLVSPALLLMQAMAVGGMGSAVTATIARAAAGGNRHQVQSLAMHAVLIAIGCGIGFAVALHLGGSWFYQLLGARDGVLDAALAYSSVLFVAAPLMWLIVILGAILRGLGVVRVQAAIAISASLLLLPLSPLLIFGSGPIPGLGICGAAIAVICYYALSAAMYLAYLASGGSVIRFRFQDCVLSGRDFGSILRLGGISSLLAIQSHMTALMIAGFAGSFGTVVLAGFGTAMRLQHVLEPFIFSLGSATVMMVATCVGAGDIARARRVVYCAAVMATVFCGVIGALAALYPAAWMAIFTSDPAVIAAGAVYLRIIGPFYWCLGLGLVLYYCSQGMGRMWWSYAGSLVRLAMVAVAGTVCVSVLDGDAASLYRVVAAAMAVSCAVTACGIVCSDWARLLPISKAPASA